MAMSMPRSRRRRRPPRQTFITKSIRVGVRRCRRLDRRLTGRFPRHSFGLPPRPRRAIRHLCCDWRRRSIPSSRKKSIVPVEPAEGTSPEEGGAPPPTFSGNSGGAVGEGGDDNAGTKNAGAAIPAPKTTGAGTQAKGALLRDNRARGLKFQDDALKALEIPENKERITTTLPGGGDDYGYSGWVEW
jgi:hypothetical protein